MSAGSITLALEPGEVVGAFLLGSLCFVSCFHVIAHRTGAYGVRNWAVMTAAALLFTIALFCSTALTLFSVTLTLHPSDSALPSSVLPLTLNGGLLTVAFVVPFLFILFGTFLAAHPDSHRYLRLPIGVAVIAVGTTASQFLCILALSTRGTFALAGAWVAGVVLVGLVAVPAVLCALLKRQQRYAVTTGVELAVSVAMALCVEAMHVMVLEAMQWSPDSTAIVSSPLHPLLYPLAALSCVSFLALAASVAVRLSAASKSRQSSSQCFSVSALVMDSSGRVLVTTSGHLPSIRIENVYLGQGAFDSFNRDFLLMLSTSLHWQDAFTTLHQLTVAGKDGGVAQSTVTVFSQFVHAACQLAHTLQISLSQLGFLYSSPIDDRLVLLSTAAHAGRMTEAGLYRWVPREVVDSYLRAEHGPLKRDSGDKMVKLLSDDYRAQDGSDWGWVAELEHYYQQFQLGVEQRAAAAARRVDIAIEIPSSPPLVPVSPLGKLEVVSEAGEKPPSLPRARSVTLPGYRLGRPPVSPVNAAQLIPAADGDRQRGTSMPVLEVVRAAEKQMETEKAIRAATAETEQPTPTSPAAEPSEQIGSSATVDDGQDDGSDRCRLYLGMFLAKITGQQLSVLISRNGPSHLIPCVRLRLNTSSADKTALTDEERLWLSQQMDNAAINALPIATNLHSFPRSALPAAGGELSRFQTAFYTAAVELSALLGGGKHVAFGKLLSVHPVSLSPSVHMLVCCESVLTPHFPVGYDRRALSFMPSKVFEALNAARWPQCRPSDWTSKCLLSTARAFNHHAPWVEDKELFQLAGTNNAKPVASALHSRTLSTQRSVISTAPVQRSLPGSPGGSAAPSKAGSKRGSPKDSRPGSRAGSRPGSAGHSRAESWEMKEKMVMMGGKLVTLVSVRDADEEKEREQRHRVRRERRLQRELKERLDRRAEAVTGGAE